MKYQVTLTLSSYLIKTSVYKCLFNCDELQYCRFLIKRVELISA